MEEHRYRGAAVHRGDDGSPTEPRTGELSGEDREVVRLLEGRAGRLMLTEVSSGLPEVPREDVLRAVHRLAAAGIVEVDPGHGEPVVRLRLPVDEPGAAGGAED